MVAALSTDISSLISVTETVTGLDRRYFVNSVATEIVSKETVFTTWTLAPADETSYWVVGVPGRCEVGQNNVVGPF
jgi:hypothetical protein